ncbi:MULTISPECIES: LysR family transcriptional regulator [Pseudomonas]|uniref:helix-turn-helix domain-containing protein n=1 Tax=Pseudomonas TaxID=286 RepID=UPI0011AF8188|nr:MULTISPECIES: LysR family transcriptional regulator [Pseudomonas]
MTVSPSLSVCGVFSHPKDMSRPAVVQAMENWHHRSMSGTNDWLLFLVWISQAQSLSEAARYLNLPKSTVSWRISDLEERSASIVVSISWRSVSMWPFERELSLIRPNLKKAERPA